jgi:cell division protein ZapB
LYQRREAAQRLAARPAFPYTAVLAQRRSRKSPISFILLAGESGVRNRRQPDALTANRQPPIVPAMSEGKSMLGELQQISGQLDRLLELCHRLAEENRSLRVSQEQLTAERANLLAKNEQARSRVEAMIARLRSLENNA